MREDILRAGEHKKPVCFWNGHISKYSKQRLQLVGESQHESTSSSQEKDKTKNKV